jgi:hypothetical protein
MNRDLALNWLYQQLKKKQIALANVEKKPNTTEIEINNIKSAISSIEWIIQTVKNT